ALGAIVRGRVNLGGDDPAAAVPDAAFAGATARGVRLAGDAFRVGYDLRTCAPYRVDRTARRGQDDARPSPRRRGASAFFRARSRDRADLRRVDRSPSRALWPAGLSPLRDAGAAGTPAP